MTAKLTTLAASSCAGPRLSRDTIARAKPGATQYFVGKFLYLATVIDCCSRKLAGWAPDYLDQLLSLSIR